MRSLEDTNSKSKFAVGNENIKIEWEERLQEENIN